MNVQIATSPHCDAHGVETWAGGNRARRFVQLWQKRVNNAHKYFIQPPEVTRPTKRTSPMPENELALFYRGLKRVPQLFQKRVNNAHK